jgi:hypothetical protein
MCGVVKKKNEERKTKKRDFMCGVVPLGESRLFGTTIGAAPPRGGSVPIFG